MTWQQPGVSQGAPFSPEGKDNTKLFSFRGKEFFMERKPYPLGLSFIPKHLEIEGRPELYHFSNTIVIARATQAPDGKLYMAQATYQPDLESYAQAEHKTTMRYPNSIDEQYYFDIRYSPEGITYCAIKYKCKESVGMAFGKTWEALYAHVGQIGLVIGEPYYLSPFESNDIQNKH